MNLKFLQTANKTSQTITVQHKKGTEILGNNDTYAFVLHEGNADKIVNPIAINQTGTFAFDANKMKCKKVYYVSYVVGKNVNGLPDLNDKCTNIVAKGQPIGWLCGAKIPVSASRQESEELTKAFDYQVNIYPNPTEDKFFVEIPSVKSATLALYNTQGQIVLSQKDFIALDANHYEVFISHLPKGVYLLHLNLDGKTESKKVIIE